MVYSTNVGDEMWIDYEVDGNTVFHENKQT